MGSRCARCHGRQPEMTSRSANHGDVTAKHLEQLVKSNFGCCFELTFPNCDYIPPIRSESHSCPNVSLDIGAELRLPEIGASSGDCGIPTAFVAVPETAMDKYTGLESREYNVRASRKVSAMKPKSVAVAMKKPAHHHLRSRVPSLDACHHARTGCRVDDIHSSPFTAA